MAKPFIKTVDDFPGKSGLSCQLVEMSGPAPSRTWLMKFASAAEEFANSQPDDRYSYVHLVALGDGEYYGCNRRGDYFAEAVNKKYHNTFTKHAKCYKHHDNDDEAKSCGIVPFSTHNDRMHRVELIVGWDKDICQDELAKVASGEPVATSMSCRVPFDICSWCGNKAKNRSVYCEHLRDHMGKVADDGQQIYAINTQPTFFDQSIVVRPASRIAFAFAKVADKVEKEEANKPSEEIASASKISRGSIVKKIDNEAELPFTTNEKPQVIDALSHYPPARVFDKLHNMRISLSLPAFIQLVSGLSGTDMNVQDGVIRDAVDMLPGPCSDVNDKLVSTYRGMPGPDLPGLGLLVSQLLGPFGLGMDGRRWRIRARVITGGDGDRAYKRRVVVAKTASNAARLLADHYAAYTTALMGVCEKRGFSEDLRLIGQQHL